MDKLKHQTKMISIRQIVIHIYREVREILLHPRAYVRQSWQGSRHRGWKRWVVGAKRLKICVVLSVLITVLIMPLFTGKSYAETAGPNYTSAVTTAANGTSTNWTGATNASGPGDNVYASVSL